MTKVMTSIKRTAKALGSIVLIAVALVAGFFIGYYYWVMMDKKHDSPLKRVRTITTTSVAINERNELMIIDRASGNYSVYQDSVGLTIFNLYANQRYTKLIESPGK